ncbi:MAG: insulinase family protein [Kofleriaceae bacterium]|nr:insulinase family protein [Kofleriaceae bacterium]
MRVARFVLALLGACALASSVVLAELEPAKAPTLTVATETLPNGLRVIVSPDPSVSSVVVHVRYGGGASVDRPGNTGYAHLVERLLSAGTVHGKPGEFDARIEAAGGFASSVTTVDHTSVFEQVSAGGLELALFLEAERMAGLADGIREDELAKAKAAIAAEFRAAYVEQPFGLVERWLCQELRNTAYAKDPLGNGTDLDTATLASVRAFAREYIVPANATLVIVGRVEPRNALALARRYFGWIPAGSPLTAPVMPLVARPVEEPRLYKPRTSWPTFDDPVAKVVVGYAPGDRSSDSFVQLKIAARVLAGARSSRLVRALVDQGLATDVRAEVIRAAGAAELHITVLPTEGTNLFELGKKIRREVAGLANTTDEEHHRAALAAAQDLVAAVENLAFRADALASWQAYDREANHLDAELELIRGARTSDLHRTARLLGERYGIVAVGRPQETP